MSLPPKPLTVASVVRPAALTAAMVVSMVARNFPAFAVASVATAFEVAWWLAQLAKAYQRRLPAALLALGALLAWIVNPVRIGLGVAVAFGWLLITPIWMVNRDRWKAMRARRRAAVVEQVRQEAADVGTLARCAAALKILRGAPAPAVADPPPLAPMPAAASSMTAAPPGASEGPVLVALPNGEVGWAMGTQL